MTSPILPYWSHAEGDRAGQEKAILIGAATRLSQDAPYIERAESEETEEQIADVTREINIAILGEASWLKGLKGHSGCIPAPRVCNLQLHHRRSACAIWAWAR